MVGALTVAVVAAAGVFGVSPLSQATPGTGGNVVATYTVAPFKYQVHRFTSNGTFTPPAGVTLNANYLVVGGGGGSVGGRPGVMYGCGGGGGQLLEGSTTISSSQAVTIGSGGTAGGVYKDGTGTIILGPDGVTDTTPTFVQGGAGTPSSLGTITAVGGGGAVSNGPSSCRGGASTLANGTVVAGRLSSGISGAGGSGSNGVGPAPIRNGAYGAGSTISTGAIINYGGGGSSCDGVGNGTTTGSATAAGQNGAANRGSGGGAGSVPPTGNCNGNTPQATPGKLGGSGFVAVRYKLFTITYNGNTNTGGTTPPQVVDVADGESFTTAPATAFTKANAVFTGWNTAADGSGTTVAANASWGPSGQPASAVTLYAQWRPVEYNVHFDPNGAGTTGTMADQHFIYANGNTLRPNAFARTGYTFQGWNSQDDGNGVDYADGAVGDTLTNVDGSTVTLYAKWSINHYSVSFNANGGTGTMPDQPFTVNTPQALAANTFTRPGYPFAGWNTKADGTGTSYTDQQVVNNLSTTDGAVVPLFAMWSGLSLVKSASPSDAESYNPGQPITYSFVVTNTETTTITGVTVSEEDFDGSGPMSPIQCPAGAASLAPGAQVTCTATYVVTQDDVDSGAITNSATAHGSAPDGAAVTSEQADVTIPGNQQPAVGLTKSVASPSGPVSQVGDVITYRFRVTNLGNVTLKDAQIDDQQDLPAGPLTSGPTCPTQNFLPGQYVDCTATYTVTQADLDHGSITNTATAAATGPLPLGAVVTSGSSSVTVPVDQVATLDLVKTASPSDPASYVVGQSIQYTFDVTNTGNRTLTGVTVTEDEFTGSGVLTPMTCPPAPVSLAPGAHLTCTADYVVTQEDIDRGTTLNRATAHATGPVAVDSAQAEVELSGNPVRSLGLEKRAADIDDVNGDQQVNVDDTIAYEFDLTNTGTVTLTLPEVSDPLAGPVTCPAVSLGPTQTTTCTADDLYVITQADLDLGHVDNTATGTALDPSAATVTSAPDTVRTLLDKDPGLELDKQVAEVTDVNGNNRTDIGDTITYQFVLTNVRTVTLTNLTVSDPTLGAVTCPGGNLPPRQAVTCQSTSVHTVTEADIEAGQVTNFASAAATTLTNDPVAANDDTTTTPIDQVTSVTLDKNVAKVTDANRNQVTDVGDEIRWVFVVTNTGTTRVTGITISDPMLAGAAITIPCPATNLPSGGSMTCEADGGYPISAADAAAGAVVNAATVMADGLASQPVSGRSDATRTAVSATPQTPPTELPSTGGPPRVLPWFGALLTLAGAALVMIHRRRRA